jgi:hypothetical protein
MMLNLPLVVLASLDQPVTLPTWAVVTMVSFVGILLAVIGYLAKETLSRVSAHLSLELGKLAHSIDNLGTKLETIRDQHIRHDERIKNLDKRVEQLETGAV